MSKKLKGKLTISRVGSNVNEGYVKFELSDEKSGVMVIEGEIGLREFAECVTGRGYVPCEFTLRGADRIGMRLETKVEWIRVHQYIVKDTKEQAGYCRALEKDRWQASISDLENGNNYNKVGDHWECKVNMYRYVEDEE